MNTTQTRIALAQLRQSFRETANEQTDLDLLGRFAAGDEHAFALLVHRHGRMVLGVCRGVLHNRADAEDAFQAVFLALARKASHPFSGACLGGWLHAVARRAAGNLRAGETRRRIHERNAGERDRPSALSKADLREALDEEVARLPASCREAILRCYFDGQTREQAACQLGWSLRTLDRRLEQGRELLRERLSARGTTLGILLALAPAAVPSALADLTVSAALGEAPPRVAELAGTALPALSVLRGKIILACLLLIGLATGSVLALLPRTPPPVRTAAPPPAQRAAVSPPLEQPLPEGALARLGTTRFRHGYHIDDVAYSPNGKVLASCGTGRGLCLWDSSTGRLLHHCSSLPFPFVSALAFSRDGRTVAGSYSYSAAVRLWSIETGKELRTFTGQSSGVTALAFAPRGDILATAGHDNTIRLWDPGTGRETLVLKGHTSLVNRLTFRDDGRVLASASGDGTVRLWDPRAGTQLHVCEGHGMGVFALAFEPAGKRLVSGGVEGTVRVWDSDSGKLERILASEKQGAHALAFAPDGHSIAVGRVGVILLHDSVTGKEIRRWQAHITQINQLAWSPDGKTLASCATFSGTVRRWDVKTGKERTVGDDGHVGGINYLVFRRDGRRLYSAGLDGRLLEWDLATRKSRRISTVSRVAAFERIIAITTDGKTLAWTSGRTTEPSVHLEEVATGKELYALTGHKGGVLAVAFSTDGRQLVSFGEDATVRAWRVETAESLWQARLGDPRTRGGRLLRPLAFSPDGKRVACPFGSTLHVLDSATGKEIRKYDNGREMYDLAWSPDNSYIALVGGRSTPRVAVWNVGTGEITRSWEGPKLGIGSIAFSPDGRHVAGGGHERDNSRVYLWELATGGTVAVFEGHHSGVARVVFAPDNRMLVSSGGDSSILLWDMTRRMRDGKLPPAVISAARFAHLWEKLADTDAAAGHAAISELVAGGSGVLPMLKAKLSAARALDPQRAAKLVERLESDEFKTRQSATKEAEKLGLGAEPALRKALGSTPGLEPRRRVDALVAGWLRSSDWLRFRRAVAVLEYNGSAEAKEVLTSLGRGAEGAQPTQEATVALDRLRERR